MNRYKDRSSWEGAHLAVLMDLRDELKVIRGSVSNLELLFSCSSFRTIPSKIDAIRKNTQKKPREKKPAQTKKQKRPKGG